MTILKDENIVAIRNNWFGIICRISLDYNEEPVNIENFIEDDLSDYMVKGMIQDLNQKASNTYTFKILKRILLKNEDASYFYTEIIKWILNNPVFPNNKFTANFFMNLSKIITNRFTFIDWDLSMECILLEAIIYITFKNSLEIRRIMKRANLFEIRDKILVSLIRLTTDSEDMVKI